MLSFLAYITTLNKGKIAKKSQKKFHVHAISSRKKINHLIDDLLLVITLPWKEIEGEAGYDVFYSRRLKHEISEEKNSTKKGCKVKTVITSGIHFRDCTCPKYSRKTDLFVFLSLKDLIVKLSSFS